MKKSRVLLASAFVACGGVSSTDVFDPAPPGKDGGATNDSGGPDSQAGVDASKDVSAVMDVVQDQAMPPPSDPGIGCPGASKPDCTPMTELCCFSAYAKTGSCLSLGGYCDPASVQIRCDDTADCTSGQTCCGHIMKNVYGYVFYTDVTCSGSCTPDNNFPGYRKFCNPTLNGTAYDECTSLGLTCKASADLVGYSVCSP